MIAAAAAKLEPVVRARIWLGLTGVLMLLGLALLLRGALDAGEREQLLRREALAARVFDELEGALASLVAGEQARPFVQWRREWVAPGAGAATRSPLAALPSRAFVRGYFQIEPDGRFASPMFPGPEQEVEVQEPARARVEELRALNEDLSGRTLVAMGAEQELGERGRGLGDQVQQQELAPPPQQAQQNKQQAVPKDVQIQRALDQQSITRQLNNANVSQDAFDPDLDALSSFVGPGNAELIAGGGAEADALDLRVTGFVARPVASREALRLVRTVDIGESRWVQGIVLDRGGLERWLEAEVLGSPELAGLVELDWTPGTTHAPALGRWVHRFGPPFAALEVSTKLGPVERLGPPSARVILGLGLGLGLALLIVLVAVERTFTGLIERAEERERFVAAVTHELRTPLTSIRMYAEMLEQGIVPAGERQRSYQRTIRVEAERLSRLVEQVLTLARVEGEAGQGWVGEGERAPLDPIVASVIELLEPQARARGVDVDVDVEAVAGRLELPRDPLVQILTNLVDNAVKFSPEGAQAVVELRAWCEGSTLRVRVRDRGPGVEAELLARIFEPFVRARREHEQAVEGTGIGLAVVRALVDELGGRVVGRNRGDGPGFEVELSFDGLRPPRRS